MVLDISVSSPYSWNVEGVPMTPTVSIHSSPCPDPECIDGKILVYNAYSADPLKPEVQPCDICNGTGFLVHESTPQN